MSNELILLLLRIISALLLIIFLGALYRILWRDQRRAVAEIDIKRQTYGYLVMLREMDGHYHLTGEKYMLKPITSLGRSKDQWRIFSFFVFKIYKIYKIYESYMEHVKHFQPVFFNENYSCF